MNEKERIKEKVYRMIVTCGLQLGVRELQDKQEDVKQQRGQNSLRQSGNRVSFLDIL